MPDWWNSPITWGQVVIVSAGSVLMAFLSTALFAALRRRDDRRRAGSDSKHNERPHA